MLQVPRAENLSAANRNARLGQSENAKINYRTVTCMDFISFTDESMVAMPPNCQNNRVH